MEAINFDTDDGIPVTVEEFIPSCKKGVFRMARHEKELTASIDQLNTAIAPLQVALGLAVDRLIEIGIPIVQDSYVADSAEMIIKLVEERELGFQQIRDATAKNNLQCPADEFIPQLVQAAEGINNELIEARSLAERVANDHAAEVLELKRAVQGQQPAPTSDAGEVVRLQEIIADRDDTLSQYDEAYKKLKAARKARRTP
jgi:hypothetical protein